MNRAQLIVLGVAVVAGGGAFTLMNGESPQAPTSVAAPTVAMDSVLVAAHDLSYGMELQDPDVKWMDWPKDAIPPGVIQKSAEANALDALKGSFVRIPVSNGEPVRRERLVKGVTAGLMSTMLPTGMRAVAIDVSANNTAGGFILPNDRVDVIRIYRDAAASKDAGLEVMASEVVLKNVRVLAMGQTIEKKGAEPVVVGSTATLELTPSQAERVLLAQRTGQLALSLRAITDAFAKVGPEDEAVVDDTSISLVKHGVTLNFRPK
jgi:pilus assembly protein CpaB